MTEPYYADHLVELYLGDCLDVGPWLSADVLVSDPPYGRGWKQGHSKRGNQLSDRNEGIANDHSTETRDAALELWGERRAVVFGDLMLEPPAGTKQVLIYRKPRNAGTRGCVAGYRRDLEAIYLIGKWSTGINARTSSLITTKEPGQGGAASPQGRFGHPHAKPIDVMCALIGHTQGVITDPFAGSGSTLVAAKLLGRTAIGVEIDEAHAEMAAKRLSHGVLDFGEWEA